MTTTHGTALVVGTSLVTTTQLRALVNTSLSELHLQDVIDRVETQISERIGDPQTDAMATSVTKTMPGEGYFLYMPTEIHSVVSIVDDGNALTSAEYQTWGGGVIERLPCHSYWGDRVVVTYKPVDDRAKRRQVIIDLVRLVLERTALKSESIAGEYSYTAPENWDAEFRKAMRRLMFKAI
jgi:hypothetical protein